MKSKKSFYLSMLLISYLSIIILLFNIFAYLKINNLMLIQVLSILIPILFYINKKINKEKIQVILLYILIIVLFPFLYSNSFDISCDGNSYHKTAIGYIENGWNPIFETTKEFYNRNENVPKINEKTSLWIEHYPNGNWIISAVMYKMTGSVESGKSVILILSSSLFLLLYSLISEKINKKMSIFISFLACYSPIVISQIFTYYIDGILGICLCHELLFLIMLSNSNKNKLLYLGLFTTIVLASGLKFTGFAFSGIFVFIFYVKEIYKFIRKKEYKKIRNITLYFIVLYIIFLLIGGGTTYINNFISHGNPFYPLQGEGKVDIITSMQPKSFEDMSSSKKNIISLFSKTDNISYTTDHEPKLKLPFLVYRNEIVNTSDPDTRIGGMGPLFTYSLILSIISLIYSLRILYKKDNRKFKLIIYALLTIIISIMCLSERWWARYVPQMYYIPIIALISLCLLKEFKYKIKITKILFAFLAMAIFTNSSIYWYYRFNEFTKFKQIKTDLIQLSKNDMNYLKLNGEEVYGVYFNLKDYKVNYQINPSIENTNAKYIFDGKIMVKE